MYAELLFCWFKRLALRGLLAVLSLQYGLSFLVVVLGRVLAAEGFFSCSCW